MIPNQESRQVTGQGLTGSRGFTVSNFSFIKMILRDKIYKDKVLAVLREYGSNAWDAHRMPGGPGADVPISVTLPTILDPVLRIRDFGPGLTPEQMHVFTDYGNSTKRDTNDAAGCLGLGCKSGFAYGDQFTVISYTGGKKRIYNAVLTDDGDDFALMGEADCGDETGVEIRIPVRTDDISRFEQTAQKLYTHFEPHPDINTILPEVAGKKREHGYIDAQEKAAVRRTQCGSWLARMGPVPYKIDLDQLRGLPDVEDLLPALHKMNGVLFFPMGAVDFTVSREELEYTDATKAALVVKFRSLVDEYTEEILDTLHSSSKTDWAKRLHASYMRRDLRLPVPDRYRDWCRAAVPFSRTVQIPKGQQQVDPLGNPITERFEKPTLFSLRSGGPDGAVTDRVSVSLYAKALLRDPTNKRHLSGYRLHADYIIVTPAGGASLDEASAEFKRWCPFIGITGITIDNLSGWTWTPDSTGKTPNRKHSVQSFRAAARVSPYRQRLSSNWEIEKRTPEASDVFVVLHSFKVKGSNEIYIQITEDRALAAAFGKPYPEVYGYKSTARKIVTAADCTGTEYSTWRVDFFRDFLNSTMKARISAMHWAKILPMNFGWDDNDALRGIDDLLGLCRSKLGLQHPITQVVSSQRLARKTWNNLSYDKQKGVAALAVIFGTSRRPTSEIALERALSPYPILEATEKKLGDLFNDDGLWLDYILMADKAAGRAF